MSEIKQELEQILNKFEQAADLKAGDILVVGCSTSEISGNQIGKSPSDITGELVVKSFLEKFKPLHINLAFQCCEHLNRALVVERELAEEKNFEIVNVVPYDKAGGAAAAAAYQLFNNPVVIEFIKADAGIDIGDTFIGMHLKHVAVPIRLDGVKKLGESGIKFARTRPKNIGGERAKYL